MKGQNGIQMNVHPEFINFKKQIKNDRIKAGKENNGDLSDKRLTLTFVRLFKARPDVYNMIINADIDLKEE